MIQEIQKRLFFRISLLPFDICLLPFDLIIAGGGGENRTLVWQPFTKASTYLAASIEVSLSRGIRSGEEPRASYARKVSLSDSDLHQKASR